MGTIFLPLFSHQTLHRQVCSRRSSTQIGHAYTNLHLHVIHVGHARRICARSDLICSECYCIDILEIGLANGLTNPNEASQTEKVNKNVQKHRASEGFANIVELLEHYDKIRHAPMGNQMEASTTAVTAARRNVPSRKFLLSCGIIH